MSRIKRIWHKDHKSEFQLRTEIRRKRSKTKAEKLFMKYYRIYFYVSEVLVDYSKGNRSAEQTLADIRKYLYDNQ